jgi:hypothetical protein
VTISFSMTGRQVVEEALKELAILAPGQTLDAAELEDGLTRLNFMFKSWGADGVSPWTDTDGTTTIAAGNPEVELSPRPLAVIEARVTINGVERQLAQWDQSEYASLPIKTSVGNPTAFSLRHAADSVKMRVWPVPSANVTVDYTYTRVLEDVDADTPIDVPQMWSECVVLGLASRIGAMFGADPGRLGLVQQRAAVLERKLYDWDRPASYHYERDY